ncbi:unnamed protein product [Cylicocyclus nassatus]|uniref:Uncharacterized protein n=1 Tax=Cylicocyclus nassatus TaxID=53992 RepID=A0AA36H1W6_CYLNA|nr:unnamed protein product [Cylicocyclus nassatus]
MSDVESWKWDASAIHLVVVVLLAVALVLLLLCLLGLLVYKKSHSAKPKTTTLSSPAVCRYNEAFDYDEISASRIEQRRCEREARLHCDNPRADVALDRIDRSTAAALAVEQLLRDSYIFDTHVMNRPTGNVRVVAAKRDYI